MQPMRPKYPAMATASAAPSSGSVAEPSSSSSTSDCGGCRPRNEIDVGDVRGKSGKILLDRLVVADIGEHRIEDRHFGAVGGNRNSRLRHQGQQAQRFEGNCFSASVRAGDDQLPACRLRVPR